MLPWRARPCPQVWVSGRAGGDGLCRHIVLVVLVFDSGVPKRTPLPTRFGVNAHLRSSLICGEKSSPRVNACRSSEPGARSGLCPMPFTWFLSGNWRSRLEAPWDGVSYSAGAGSRARGERRRFLVLRESRAPLLDRRMLDRDPWHWSQVAKAGITQPILRTRATQAASEACGSTVTPCGPSVCLLPSQNSPADVPSSIGELPRSMAQ